ncbi:MAG: DUF1343 domain-containing protein [Candidatus Stahlbacteria bacterium]|nr:DUF1343 domain-containing protein [Candidatus Stahlbacteria bacterium]
MQRYRERVKIEIAEQIVIEMRVKTGIDVCVEEVQHQNGFREFKGKWRGHHPRLPPPCILRGQKQTKTNAFARTCSQRIGLLVHPASVDSNLNYTQDLFLMAGHPDKSGYPFSVKALFSPEHGLYGTQQYMEEVRSEKLKVGTDYNLSLPLYSLYGKTKEELAPTKKMLDDIDTIVIDLQDIGVRYYTYIWTMVLTLQSCAQCKIQVIVLDRPNPLNGVKVEGPILAPEFSSFVGLYPIPVRHGMTIGELAFMFNSHFNIGAELKVIKMQGWERNMWFDETGLPWVMPSPNMPTLDTAIVYPGMCLLEGTNISEGRGTTKPFELFGAPFIDHQELCATLNKEHLPGVIFRPMQFIPTTSKYTGEQCKGGQLHITNRDEFLSFMTGVVIIKTIKQMYPDLFKWRSPPYEYEEKQMPFDLLAGDSRIRELIERDVVAKRKSRSGGSDIRELLLQWEKELHSFASIRDQYLLY